LGRAISVGTARGGTRLASAGQHRGNQPHRDRPR